jgi:2-C-methyl-D-erythritol 4-phosphate cytidylyltransferase/2-C-methyl-D-erythritol 2,4-cyclodiphosphate synthase
MQQSVRNIRLMGVGAVIVAAGSGSRAGGELPKQYQTLLGRPILAWSVAAISAAGVAPIVVVTAPAQAERARIALGDWPDVLVTAGGATRTASVRAGLTVLSAAETVLIHDAARPGLSPDMVRRLVAAIEAGADGAAPALPVADSLRRRSGEEVARDDLMRVQTPQAFRGDVIRNAYAASVGDFTDDLSIAKANGARIELIAGDPKLLKYTHPEDLIMLEAMLGGARVTCVGTGFDAHRFGPGDHVMLCGVRVAHDKGMIGHSDADVAWHALVDAILGALGAGDIGQHFPPSDPQWKGAASELFLRHAAKLAAQADARIAHVDITLICERPKVGPHREAMRAATAEVLGLPLSRVSVKATTTERMGFAGREEGLAAQAIATLDRPA